MRSGAYQRSTKETAVEVALTLEGSGRAEVRTAVKFFDHMLAQWCFHGRLDVSIDARSFDGIKHHLVEDVALAVGAALDRALGERIAIARYGAALIPMDEALARVAVDFSGRPFAKTSLRTAAASIEDLEVDLVPHFFSSFAQTARMAIHADVLAGENGHHCVEALFKAAGVACAQAWRLDEHAGDRVPSTKGTLG